MAEYGDRIKETTATTGTGTLDLAGAVTGFQAFVDAISNGAYVPYVIEASNGAWETGYGLFTNSSPDTLARSTVTASSNAGAAITLPSGTHTVYVGLHAHAAGHRGALAYNNTGQVLTTGVSAVLEWDSEEYDTDSFHDNSTNNSRFTIPVWASRVRVTTNVVYATNVAGRRRTIIFHNGVATKAGLGGTVGDTSELGTGSFLTNVESAIIDVVGGDYLEVEGFQNSGGDLTVGGASTEQQHWFAIEVLE